MTRLHTLVALLSLSLSMSTWAASANVAEPAAPADAWPGTQVGQAVPATPSVPPELVRNLAKFDDLDFRVYTNQQWQDLHKTHSPDVIMH